MAKKSAGGPGDRSRAKPPAPPEAAPPSADEPQAAAPAGGGESSGSAPADEPVPKKKKKKQRKTTKKKEPPQSAERVECALALLSAHIQSRGLDYIEVDALLGRRPGYTHRLMRGRTAYTHRTARTILAALGIDEEQFERESARQIAFRRLRGKFQGLIPSPHKRRARHPRPSGHRIPASQREEEEPPAGLYEPELWNMLGEIEDWLYARLGIEKPTEPDLEPDEPDA